MSRALSHLTVACVQVTAGADVEANLEVVRRSVRDARAAGAELIVTPENVVLLEGNRTARLEKAERPEQPLAVPAFAGLARETGAWILAGSIATRLPDDETRLANRAYLFDPSGATAATYDKIHMFDVDLAGGESYRESANFRPGARAVVAASPWGGIGLSICYDLRFAALYRALAQAGARIIVIPSAFTVPTGEAHWHTLVRARAIETGCFVLAPAQTGTHAGGRKTYGHSLIVSPWGKILTDGGTEPGIVTATLDLDQIETARGMVPSLSHDRAWSGPEIVANGSSTTPVDTRSL